MFAVPIPNASALPASVYRQPGFLPFLISRVLAMFAVQILAVVVAWQVYDMTRDPLSLAYVGLAQFVPMLLLLMPAGDLIDRYDRKRILVLSWGLEALCAAALLWLSLSGGAVSSFYIVLVFYGCARAFTGPALSSLLPQIVPREKLAAAIAANSMIVRGSTIAGPVFGGGLYALGGGGVTYAACLAFFLAGIGLLRWVPVRYAEAMQALEATAWQRFTAGIRFIRSRPIILGTLSLDLFAVLLGGVVALLPIYAQDVLEVGPAGLGALRSAMALGEVAVGFYLSTRPWDAGVQEPAPGGSLRGCVAGQALIGRRRQRLVVFPSTLSRLPRAGATATTPGQQQSTRTAFVTPLRASASRVLHASRVG